ncbi:MAG: hypothetical protein Q7K57_12270 [Burkholderiaceae bacterium]|nr:hypothetical protein [Burkholderiaceae bacterium]
MYQQRYWTQLKHLKTHVYYTHFYAIRTDAVDKGVNIFLALTSTSSIAAWAVFKEYAMLWAGIIALAQVITAVKPFLPFRQRLKGLVALGDALQTIGLESEKGWYNVSEGKWSDELIHEKIIELAAKINKAEQKCLAGVVLPHKKKILKLAEAEADKYLTMHYHGEQDEHQPAN